MNKTSIEWTTFSANPLKYRDASGDVVWGCVHASPGCINCYSEATAKRWDKGGPFNVPTMNGLTPFLDEGELHHMLTAKTIEKTPVSGSRCFVGDMTDIFGEWVPDDLLNRLFSHVLEIRTDVTWQILTKRAERMHRYLSWRWGGGRIPSRHIHIGVSCEDQKRADERIPHLLQTPVAVRFISAEPLLEGLDIAKHRPGANRLWVIVGGESGHGARPCRVWWIRNIVGQCRDADVPVFVKQFGSAPEIEQGCGDCDPCLHGQRCYQSYHIGMELKDHKGGNMSEWPEDLRIRQFPGDR
jgi:protein gp37